MSKKNKKEAMLLPKEKKKKKKGRKEERKSTPGPRKSKETKRIEKKRKRKRQRGNSPEKRKTKKGQRCCLVKKKKKKKKGNCPEKKKKRKQEKCNLLPRGKNKNLKNVHMGQCTPLLNFFPILEIKHFIEFREKTLKFHHLFSSLSTQLSTLQKSFIFIFSPKFFANLNSPPNKHTLNFLLFSYYFFTLRNARDTTLSQ